MPESLYTPNDVKRVRDELVKKQKGIDPILKEPFKEMQVLYLYWKGTTMKRDRTREPDFLGVS